MPKRKEPELDPKEQFKRFKKAAEEHEIDKRSEDVERAFNKIASTEKSKTSDRQDR